MKSADHTQNVLPAENNSAVTNVSKDNVPASRLIEKTTTGTREPPNGGRERRKRPIIENTNPTGALAKTSNHSTCEVVGSWHSEGKYRSAKQK